MCGCGKLSLSRSEESSFQERMWEGMLQTGWFCFVSRLQDLNIWVPGRCLRKRTTCPSVVGQGCFSSWYDLLLSTCPFSWRRWYLLKGGRFPKTWGWGKNVDYNVCWRAARLTLLITAEIWGKLLDANLKSHQKFWGDQVPIHWRSGHLRSTHVPQMPNSCP